MSDRYPISKTLGDRQLQILGLIAQGRTNVEIGREMFISENTVKNQVGAIFGKLGAKNRTECVHLAYQARLLEPTA